MSEGLSALYAAVAEWAASQGAADLNSKPGLWRGKTKKIGALGPLDVKINAHDEDIEAIPPYHIFIGMEDYFPGIIALISPSGGAVASSPKADENEDGLIAHFAAQITEPRRP